MTRIDFYILENASTPQAAELFICRLAEKAFNRDHSIYINTPSAETAENLDNLLWTFREGSFIPHRLHHQPHPAACPVIIGYDHEPQQLAELMINHSQAIPSFFSRFDRVAEIVSGDEEARNQARERFRFYRDRGYELETHTIK